MKAFPLVRTKWTNEHVMAALFVVLILYMIPTWLKASSGILSFLAVLAVGFLIDVTVNTVRYKKPVCSVSAAVTAGVLYILTPGTPIWIELAGIAAALVLGKQIWGGTGKNPVNPAMVGLIAVCMVHPVEQSVLTPSWLLIPAILLSLPFIAFRPFASTGFILGAVAGMIAAGSFSPVNLVTTGIVFLGCLVVTDPVTSSANPLVGLLGGLLSVLLPLFLSGSVLFMALGILLFNVISFATDDLDLGKRKWMIARVRVKKLVDADPMQVEFIDLSNKEHKSSADVSSLTSEEILNRIEANAVFGQGGAAFPTIRKLQTVISSGAQDKHLIINGAECDPGLIHDQWLMNQHTDEIIKGIELVKRCISFKSVTVAVKKAVPMLNEHNINVVLLPDLYPIGAEKILIRQVLGINLSDSQIPAKEGILVLNVQTLYSIYEAVALDKKIDSRFITASDLPKNKVWVAKVNLGANIEKTIEAVTNSRGPVFAGGGAMQCHKVSEEDIIGQNVNYIARAQYPRYKESVQCSHCALCREGCPVGLKVNKIADLVDAGKLKETGRYHAASCIQCGNCSRVCLAGRNLADRIKTARVSLNR